MKTTSIFLVDDQPIFRDGIKTFFKTKNEFLIIGEASDGDSAFPMILEKNPQVCIIDLSMPGLNGVELIKVLRAKNCCSSLIVLSQNLTSEWIQKLLESQIDGYILKSDGREFLLNAIISVTEGDKYFSPSVASLMYKMLSEQKAPAKIKTELLTSKESEVAKLISLGFSVKEIAQRLSCSENTIKTHKSSIMRKLNARNSVEVAKWVLTNLS